MDPLTDAELKAARELPNQLASLQARQEQLAEQIKKFPETALPQMKGVEQQLKALDEQRSALEKRLGERLDEVNLRLNRPGNGGLDSRTEQDKLALKAFEKLLRRGEQRLTPDDLRALNVRALEGDDGPNGGFLIPEPVKGPIIEQLLELSPIRQNAAPLTVTVGDAWEDPVETDASSVAQDWVTEREARPETTTIQYKLKRTSLKEQYAFPKATQRMLDDVGFDIAGYIGGKIAQRFAKAEGQAFLSGDGVDRPSGILTTGSAADGSQSEDQIGTTQSGASTGILADNVLTLLSTMKTPDAVGASLFMTRKTMFALRKLKDTVNGRYLWEPGLPNGSATPGSGLTVPLPSTFAGVPIIETPDMPDLTTNGNKAVMYANLREAYRIVDKNGIRILADPYTAKPYTGWYATKRVGGQVIVPRRIKLLVTGT